MVCTHSPLQVLSNRTHASGVVQTTLEHLTPAGTTARSSLACTMYLSFTVPRMISWTLCTSCASRVRHLATATEALCVHRGCEQCTKHFVCIRNMPLKSEWSAANDPELQRIAERGGEFARQWTTRSARLKYWQRALERYAELFKDYSNDLDLEKMF